MQQKPKQPVGRPPKFKTAEELNDAFLSWKETFKLGGERFGEVPDVEGFCDYIDSYRELLMEYERKPDFSRTVKRIKNWMYFRKKQLAMAGKMNATVYIFDAKNNHGYVDKTEIDQNVTGELKTGTVDPVIAQDFAEYLKNKK